MDDIVKVVLYFHPNGKRCMSLVKQIQDNNLQNRIKLVDIEELHRTFPKDFDALDIGPVPLVICTRLGGRQERYEKRDAETFVLEQIKKLRSSSNITMMTDTVPVSITTPMSSNSATTTTVTTTTAPSISAPTATTTSSNSTPTSCPLPSTGLNLIRMGQYEMDESYRCIQAQLTCINKKVDTILEFIQGSMINNNTKISMPTSPLTQSSSTSVFVDGTPPPTTGTTTTCYAYMTSPYSSTSYSTSVPTLSSISTTSIPPSTSTTSIPPPTVSILPPCPSSSQTPVDEYIIPSMHVIKPTNKFQHEIDRITRKREEICRKIEEGEDFLWR